MNYKEMLDVADYNRAEAKYEANLKRYTSDLPPPKKAPKAGVQSDGIRKFLEKKKAEEDAKLAEARKLKEKLLALRAQNSKNNKKAKIMASRTKDNDFSRIKLTDDEIQSKKKIENELQRKHLADKVERMKARIELEEKEKLLPRKRKRKSKHGEGGELNEDPHFDEDRLRDEERDSKHNSKHKDKDRLRDEESYSKHNSKHKDKDSVRKAPRPPPPAMSFSELLKVAEVKQHEPVVIPKKKEDEKLMTKKQRRIEEQEQDRIRRKIEREGTYASSKSSNGLKHSSSLKQSLPNGKVAGKPSIVEKNGTPCSAQNFKIPRGSVSVSKNVPFPKTVEKSNKVPNDRHSKEPSITSKSYTNHDRQRASKSSELSERPQVKQRPKENKSVLNNKKPAMVAKPFRRNSDVESAPVPPPAPMPIMTLDTDAIADAIEKRIREKIEKEIEAKFAAKFAANMQSDPRQENKTIVKTKPSGSVNGSHSSVNRKSLSKVPHNQPTASKRPPEKVLNSKSSMPNKKPPPPVKKPFHPNPYLDPPRKRLEPLRPQKPIVRRRIEDDSDEDDMSDFIDDGPSQNDEDYSKYIQEIFGYDRNRYVDEDDDDIVETSFGEQLKEETRSARLGFLEDLEEEKKLREMEKKRKKKLKK